MVKKTLFFITLLVFCAKASGQDLHFADMVWGSSRAAVSAQLEKQGFTNVKTDKNGDISFDGSLSEHKAHGFAWFAKDDLAKVTVHILVRNQKARETYQQLRESLIEKYGTPTDTYEFFERPYYDGDGYEEQAVRVGKGHFHTFWRTNNQILAVSITKQLNLRVAYEGPIWSKEFERRQSQGSKVF
jgi:hypothetical protein